MCGVGRLLARPRIGAQFRFGGLAHVHVNGGVQIVYGNMASSYATPMRELLGME